MQMYLITASSDVCQCFGYHRDKYTNASGCKAAPPPVEMIRIIFNPLTHRMKVSEPRQAERLCSRSLSQLSALLLNLCGAPELRFSPEMNLPQASRERVPAPVSSSGNLPSHLGALINSADVNHRDRSQPFHFL